MQICSCANSDTIYCPQLRPDSVHFSLYVLSILHLLAVNRRLVDVYDPYLSSIRLYCSVSTNWFNFCSRV